MPDIKPFNGFRYRCNDPEDLTRFIAPPYDMVDGAMVDALYAKDPCNTIRITQNRPEPQDAANRDRHRRAATFFNEWVAGGVIVRDAEPSFYVYEQEFAVEIAGVKKVFRRTGVVAMVALTDFSEGVVLPHEYTLSGPKADRYEQMEETCLNEGQIFGLLSDDDGSIYRVIGTLKKGAAVGRAVDGDGVCHTLYRCADASVNERFVAAARASTVLIADGHHRYETALKRYRDLGNDPGYGRVMMTLVSMADPGLVIRSFHRLIRRRPQDRQVDMQKELGNYFEVADAGAATMENVNAFLGAANGGGEMLFCDAASKRLCALTLSPQGERYLASVIPERSMLWKRLDMSKINAIVIGGILGLPLDGHVLHDVIDYMNNAQAALERSLADAGCYGCFFIRPVGIGAIHAVVAGGERMPQKSTNFYPKIYSGLVFNKLGAA